MPQTNADETLYGTDLFGETMKPKAAGIVAERFGCPPFSVLNARAGEWQERKRAWVGIGIESEIGRGQTLSYSSSMLRAKGGYFDERGDIKAAANVSIFDPTLTELLYTWFCPKGGQIVDPFAGGSVRGIVAGVLGMKYWGCDLSVEQIEANERQGASILPREDIAALTPVQTVEMDGATVHLKRDDLFVVSGVNGGKARTCGAFISSRLGALRGVATASSRHSPQALIVASIARDMGIECVLHTPGGDVSTGPVSKAVAAGAKIIQHSPGYNTVITRRAADYAKENDLLYVPFGMVCEEATLQTRTQVANLPKGSRLVVPVGSGMTLAGILHGIGEGTGCPGSVLGVVVGADPVKRLDEFAPGCWREMCELVYADEGYDKHIESSIGGVPLDPVYEAKCAKYVRDGDTLWIVGNREPVHPPTGVRWLCGDSMDTLPGAPDADFVFSCPPYGDLEKYSDDPRDLSSMEWHTFVAAYKRIILRAVKKLKEDRFACFVVGDFRDKRGFYRNFVSETIDGFEQAGARLYNEAILVTHVGSASMRVSKHFESGRKLAKTHQNVLVFCKGDWRKATEAINATN
jgi:hypothetical protein